MNYHINIDKQGKICLQSTEADKSMLHTELSVEDSLLVLKKYFVVVDAGYSFCAATKSRLCVANDAEGDAIVGSFEPEVGEHNMTQLTLNDHDYMLIRKQAYSASLDAGDLDHTLNLPSGMSLYSSTSDWFNRFLKSFK